MRSHSELGVHISLMFHIILILSMYLFHWFSRLFQDPIEHNVLWLRYLTYLVNIPQNLGSFVENKTAAVVMGTMAAHSDSAEIQMCATTILAQLARYRPLPNEKVSKDKPLDRVGYL